MKYKLKSDIKGKSLLEAVYENRNITKEMVERLLNSNSNEYLNPSMIFNIDKAIEYFKSVYNKQLKIGLLVDEDVDGVTSSALLYQWLVNDLEHPIENINVFLHKKRKVHGLNTSIFKDMLNSNTDLFLIADSSSNDKEEQKSIVEKEKNIIILDHHQVEDYEEIKGVYLVNNQLGDLSNEHLSGVGVVAQFIRGLGYSIDKYRDLIAIGLIADAMSMIDYQNRAYVNEGLNNVENDLIKEFLKGFKNPIIENVSYNCANFMNSVIRYGTFEEKELLWKAITCQDGIVEYKNKKGEIVQQTLQEGFVRISNNVKTRQNNAIKKAVKVVEEYVYKKGLDKDKCIIVENNNMVEGGIGGIVCQRLSNTFKRPVMIISPFDNELSGSVRSPLPLKDMLNESELVSFANGHQHAFGVGIPKENVNKLREYLNIKLRDFNVDEKVEDVDYVFNAKDLKLNQVKEVANLNNLWGKDIEEPIFAIKNITMESCKIEYKKIGICYCTQFIYNGVCFRKSFSSRVVFEEMTRKDLLKFGKSQSLDLTLLGKFKKDEKGFYYVEIQDFNSVKSSKVTF